MKQAISEIAGQASFEGHSNVVIYRALRSLSCATCGQVIAEGELFTRHSAFGQSVRILPKCRKCVPFDLRAGGEEARHPMLDVLLSPSAEKSTVPEDQKKRPSSVHAPNEAEQKRVTEAMLQRLGPALRRSRRNQK